MIKKSKLTVASIIATLFLTLFVVSGAFASQSAVDPIIAYGGNIDISNSATTGGNLKNDITVTIDDPSDLLAGSSLVLTAPSGTEFHICGTPHLILNNSSQKLRFGKSSDPNSESDFISSGGSACGSAFVLVGSGGTAAGDNVIGNISSDKTKITLNVVTASDVSPGTSTTIITIKNGTDDNYIGLIPTATATKNDTQTTGGKLSITTNANTGSAATSTLGSIDLLAPPRIVDAYVVNSTTVNVVFNVAVSSKQTASYYELYTSANGTASPATTATRSSSDSKIVTLTNSSWSLDFNVGSEYTPTIALKGKNITNASGSSIKNELTNRHVIRTASDSAISGITLDKTAVGGRYQASSKTNNKFNITFTGPTNQPIKFKLIHDSATSTTRTPTAPLDLSDCTITVSGTALSSEEVLYGAGDQTTANDDIMLIPGKYMASGSATVTVALGDSTNKENGFANSGDDDGVYGTATYDSTDTDKIDPAAALSNSAETNIKVEASIDEFNTVTTSDAITVDYKKPAIITTGDNKPKFLDRNRLTLTFNEDMNTSTLGNAELWALREGSSAAKAAAISDTDITISSVDVDSDKRTVTLTTTQTLPIGTDMYVYLKKGANVTPGQTIEDKYYNPIVTAAGTNLMGGTTKVGTTSTGKAITSVEIGNSTSGNVKISNKSCTLRVTIAADTGIDKDTIYIVAVDANNPGIANKEGDIKSGTDTGLLETTERVYQCDYTLDGSIEAESVILWVVIKSGGAPTSDSDFSDKVVSDSIEVDNTIPKVLADAELPDSKHVTVLFSDPMNATKANNTDYYEVKGESGGSLDVLDVSSIASDKKSVTLQLLQEVENGVTYFVDVTAGATGLTDDAGNPLTEADTYGIDRARFTGGETAFGVSATNVTIAPGATFTVTVSGGTSPYSIKTDSNSTIATAVLSGDTLTIEGVANGETSVVVQDSKTIPSTKTISITVSDAVTASPTTLTINENATDTFAVSGGTAPYTIASGDTSVATVDVSELSESGDVTVTGVAAGTATITVTDAGSATATVTVTVEKSSTGTPQDPPTDQTPDGEWEIPPEEIASAPVSMGSVTDDGKVENMELSLNFPAYTAPVDVYVLIAIPVAGGWGYFSVKDDGSLVDALTEGIVAYAVNTTEAIDVTIFESFAVCNPFGGAAVPEGQWFIFYLITPENGGDATAALEGNHALHFFGFTVDCE